MLSVILLGALLVLSSLSVDLPENAAISETHIGTQYFPREVEVSWTELSSGLPTTGEFTGGIALGDFNNDGKLDLAAGGGGRTWIGDGRGNWTQDSGALPPLPDADVALADLNHDGNLDLAAQTIWLGNGGSGGGMTWTSGGFLSGWAGVAVGDFNNDGNMDIISGGSSVKAYAGNGGAGGSLSWTESSNGLDYVGGRDGVALGDLNHDGKLDIVSGSMSYGVKVWLGNGGTGPAALWSANGSGLPISGGYYQVDVGDVNHDGNLDILAAGSQPRVWTGNGGAGGSMVWELNSTGLDSSGIHFGASFGDLDNDGNLDVVVADFSGSIRLWLGNGGESGSMSWSEDSSDFTFDGYVDVDLGDVNNDGKTDIAATSSNGIRVWQNTRPDFTITSYDSASVNLPTVNTWADVQMADINHDGMLDIGFTSFQSQNRGFKTFLGNGNGVWSDSSAGLPTTGSFTGLRFADLNHDGTLDIVAGEEAGVAGNLGIHVWSGSGSGSWTEMNQVSSRSCGGLETADVNNDGTVDVVTGYYAQNWGPMVHLGNGDFTWSADIGPTGETINVDDVAVADVNHDGKLDIAASSMDGVGVQLWTGDGSGASTGWKRNDSGLPTTGVYLGLALADIDHDGDSDLTATGFSGGAAGVYVWLGNGGAGGSMVWTLSSNGLPSTGQFAGVEFGDTNVDGNVDIVFADSRSAGSTGIGYRRGNGGVGGSMIWFDPGVLGIPTAGQHWGVAFGDMDNDGILDIAATGNAGVRVYKQGAPHPQPPSITITQPAGSESWTGASVQTIDWTASDPDDPVSSLRVWVNYSVTGGSPYNRQIPSLQGVAGSARPYSWTVASEDSMSVVLSATVADPTALRGDDMSATFEIDSTPPSILSTSPFSSEVGVPTSTSVLVTWSESMDTISVESAFSLKDTATWTPVSGTVAWAGTVMIFAPAGLLFPSTQYSANMTTLAADDSQPGNALAATYTWTFTTATGADSTPPTLVAVAAIPDPQEVFHPVNVSALIQDDVAVGQAWLNVTNPIGGTDNRTMSFDSSSGRYFLERGYGILGLHTFELWAADVSSNWNSNSGQFEVVDTTSPTVTDPSAIPDFVEIFSGTNLSATVTDNYQLSSVRVNVTAPDLMTTNLTMFSGARYFRVVAASQLGIHSFSIWASDTTGHWGSASGQFVVQDTVPPAILNLLSLPDPVDLFAQTNLSADVLDNYQLSGVWVNISAPDSSWTNQTMSGGLTFYFSFAPDQLGTYSFKVSAVDSSGNWNSATSAFRAIELIPPEIQHDPTATWFVLTPINLTAAVTDNNVLREAGLNYTDVEGNVRNVTMNPVGQDRFYYVVPGQLHADSLSYWFWAVDASGNTAKSQRYNTQIIERRPSPPTDLVVTPESSGTLRLQWSPPTTNNDSSPLTDLREYNVYRTSQPGGQRTRVNTARVSGTTFLDEGLMDGATYYYVVTAVNSRKIESAESNVASGTTLTSPEVINVLLVSLTFVIIMVILTMAFVLLLRRKRIRDAEQEAQAKSEAEETRSRR